MSGNNKTFKKKFVRFFYNFAFIWSYWYGFWVRFTKPGVGVGILPDYNKVDDIVRALDYGNDYVLDPLNGALDIMYHPRRVQERINSDEKIGDCDDHAIYWASCILKSAMARQVWIGTAHYQKEDGSVGGHVVCVFEDYDGNLFWGDYRMPYAVKSHEQWAKEVGEEKYGKELIASALVPVVSLAVDDTPKFGRSYRVV